MCQLLFSPAERCFSAPASSAGTQQLDGGGEVVEEGEDPLQQCSCLQGRAVPGAADVELPWHLPWFSLQLIDEVVDDLLSPGIQVESAEWGKEWWLMKEKTWR